MKSVTSAISLQIMLFGAEIIDKSLFEHHIYDKKP
jgi:hypothetical protein